MEDRLHACPGEVVTTLAQHFIQVVLPGMFLLTLQLEFDYFPNSPIGQQVNVGGFLLYNRVIDPNNATLADLTITMTVTATLARNGTVVQCQGDDPGERMSL